MTNNRDLSEPDDLEQAEAIQAEARGEGSYEPEEHRQKGLLERAANRLREALPGDRDYPDQGTNDPEL